jgi:hypothetical protein
MKQQKPMLRDDCQAARLEEISDFDAWRGYEFWSAQVEAQMVSEAFARYGLQPQPYERESDVLPF